MKKKYAPRRFLVLDHGRFDDRCGVHNTGCSTRTGRPVPDHGRFVLGTVRMHRPRFATFGHALFFVRHGRSQKTFGGGWTLFPRRAVLRAVTNLDLVQRIIVVVVPTGGCVAVYAAVIGAGLGRRRSRESYRRARRPCKSQVWAKASDRYGTLPSPL
jgi:hypothetical protein